MMTKWEHRCFICDKVLFYESSEGIEPVEVHLTVTTLIIDKGSYGCDYLHANLCRKCHDRFIKKLEEAKVELRKKAKVLGFESIHYDDIIVYSTESLYELAKIYASFISNPEDGCVCKGSHCHKGLVVFMYPKVPLGRVLKVLLPYTAVMREIKMELEMSKGTEGG